MLMNGFGPNVEFSEKGKVQYRRSAKLNCSNFENEDHGREAKNTEDCEIGRSRPEVSKEYLMVEFQRIWF